MPKILITGNGFDLSFGLPTGYSDFIKICKKLKESSKFDWNDFREDISILKISDSVPNSSFQDFESFQKRLQDSTWFNYLSRIFTINTWIDFEKYIEKALSIIQSSLNEIKTETFLKNGRYFKSDIIYYKENFHKENYEIYLTLLDFKIFLNNSFMVPQLNPIFLRSIDEFHVDFENDILFSSILNDLNTFRNIFQEYLREIVIPLYDLLKSDERRILLQKITHHFTFNYTPTFSKLVSNKPGTCFLHGELEANNIILGINEWENISIDGPNLIPFTKYFQKLNFGIDLKFINEIEGRDKLYQFFFWGHSLDKSDAIYINEVFDRIEALEKKHSKGKIIIVYHSDSSRFSIIKNLIEIRGSKDIMKKQRSGELVFLQSSSEELKKELKLNIPARSIENIRIY
ncbi:MULTISPECIES: AbiH family protein [Sphingobacterium]|uniref:AbiH family protein n=1 Tax=Sphingobacterium TaxID=28453 RepID=UPI00257BEC47|nr:MULTISPECIES: AbiH family protein [Sphingobacterium]